MWENLGSINASGLFAGSEADSVPQISGPTGAFGEAAMMPASVISYPDGKRVGPRSAEIRETGVKA
jgi:hypothetical protein